MIIVAIVALSLVVLTAVLAVFVGLPDFPPSVLELVQTAEDYMYSGLKFVNSFVYGDVILTMVSLVLAFSGVVMAYKLVMWVMKKVPMFGVD